MADSTVYCFWLFRIRVTWRLRVRELHILSNMKDVLLTVPSQTVNHLLYIYCIHILTLFTYILYKVYIYIFMLFKFFFYFIVFILHVYLYITCLSVVSTFTTPFVTRQISPQWDLAKMFLSYYTILIHPFFCFLLSGGQRSISYRKT